MSRFFYEVSKTIQIMQQQTTRALSSTTWLRRVLAVTASILVLVVLTWTVQNKKHLNFSSNNQETTSILSTPHPACSQTNSPSSSVITREIPLRVLYDCVEAEKKSDISSAMQRFEDAGYNTFLYTNVKMTSSSKIVEIGSYTGDMASEFIHRYQPHITMYEPSNVLYKKLVENFPNAKIFNYGIDWEKKSAFLLINKKGDVTATSATVFSEKEIPADSGVEKIELVSWSFVEENSDISSNTGIDLLIVNCEGCEIAVLGQLVQSPYVENIRNIYIKWNAKANSQIPSFKCYVHQYLQRTHEITHNFQ
jgi:FkbM family methyltransferase